MIVSNLLVIVISNLGSAEFVELFADTFTSILNQNYTEDVVFARSEIGCTKLCLTTPCCEAVYYNKTADDSKCFLRKYTPNILYPLIISTSLPSNTSWIFLRKHDDYRVVPPGYQFEPNLMFWYKLVETPVLSAWDAREFCRQENTYLFLIDDDNQFNFFLNILGAHGVNSVYIHGYRITENDPYLDEMGRVMTYDQNWNSAGTQGSGQYMRIAAGLIDAASGGNPRPFICQLRLN